jgi:adenylosuccinate lyase
MREQGQVDNDLLDRLAADPRLPLGRPELDELLADRLSFTGLAERQTAAVVRRIAELRGEHPAAAGYRPGDIL